MVGNGLKIGRRAGSDTSAGGHCGALNALSLSTRPADRWCALAGPVLGSPAS
jgi:hypothetical protein